MKIWRCRSELHNIRCFRLHEVTHRTRVGGNVSKEDVVAYRDVYNHPIPENYRAFHARRCPQTFSAGSNSANGTKASCNDKTHVGRTSSLSITRLINACITPLRWKR
ncbi:hypothetical protein M404DRAFT_1002686 [Pisolithus tinctorius Marx 270]|uniref:Uncharacterized protein n=1 Tax=Pisolithus tinctorius Marx 270 TaxID=870435 RepID=A0A0C3JX09_PISTI|nr:hypothetical protein M404DRAFT_1002686 [Pisolithus tinctorius Marx 270]